MPQPPEPLWRKTLCWGATLSFFLLPAIAVSIHIIAIELHWHSDDRIAEFQGVMPVYFTISSLVFGLAGLNSFDKLNGQKKFPHPQKKNLPPPSP